MSDLLSVFGWGLGEESIDIGSPALATAEDTEQAEVVWDKEEVADSIASPFLYLIVYE